MGPVPLTLGGHASPGTRCLWCPSPVIRLCWPDRGDPPCVMHVGIIHNCRKPDHRALARGRGESCEVRPEGLVHHVGPRTTGPQAVVDVGFGLFGRTTNGRRGSGAVRVNSGHLPTVHASGSPIAGIGGYEASPPFGCVLRSLSPEPGGRGALRSAAAFSGGRKFAVKFVL